MNKGNLNGDSTKSFYDPKFWDGNFRRPRLLIMTVATHHEPFLELTQLSAKAIGKTLLVAGEGESFNGIV
eukprot:gene7771-9941_t